MKVLCLIFLLFLTKFSYAIDKPEIQGIISGDDPMVIIDNQSYRVEDSFADYKILQIMNDGVILEYKGKQEYYFLNSGKANDWPSFKMKHRIKVKKANNYLIEALKCWDKSNRVDTVEEAIKLHKSAIKKAELAMPKVDSLARAQLGETCFDSRKYIKILKNYLKEHSS